MGLKRFPYVVYRYTICNLSKFFYLPFFFYIFSCSWESLICGTGNVMDCSDALGLSTNQIADDSLSATTWQPGRSDPWYGRLNNQSRRSWCATVVDDIQYLQVIATLNKCFLVRDTGFQY